MDAGRAGFLKSAPECEKPGFPGLSSRFELLRQAGVISIPIPSTTRHAAPFSQTISVRFPMY